MTRYVEPKPLWLEFLAGFPNYRYNALYDRARLNGAEDKEWDNIVNDAFDEWLSGKRFLEALEDIVRDRYPQ